MGNWVSIDIADQEGRWNGWRVIPPLRGPDGFTTAIFTPLQGNHHAVITRTLPEELMPIAVRWIDNFYTEESAWTVHEGIEGMTWERSAPGEVSIAGGPAVWNRVPLIDSPIEGVQIRIGNQPPLWRSNDWRLSERANRTIVEQETLLFDMSMMQLPYRQPLEQVLPVLIFDEATSAELVDLEVTIQSFVRENIARFTVGDICIESDWDWYIRELQVMGLERFIQIQQTAFDERLARIAAAGN